MAIMIIKYKSVMLRAIEEKDYDLLFHLINAPEIEKSIVGWNFPISHFSHKKWMKNFENSMNSIKFMIELTNAKTIGMVMLEKIDWKCRTAEIACKMCAPLEDRIKGDMEDALNGMLKYAFDELGLNCINALILEENYLSQNLYKRVGFQEEGILRERVYKGGKFRNLISLSILKGELYDERKNTEYM